MKPAANKGTKLTDYSKLFRNYCVIFASKKFPAIGGLSKR